MRSESDIIQHVMKKFPILYWPHKTRGCSDYQLARKIINETMGIMPEVVTSDVDIQEILNKQAHACVFYPIFYGTSGWWGELLGGNAIVTDKIIISSECQLMVIENENNISPKKIDGKYQLMATEIRPTSGFFKKIGTDIATVSDMLATDSGTILALFSCKDKKLLINMLESTGNSFLGCIGHY